MTKIRLSIHHQVKVVDEYWAEVEPITPDVTSEQIYEWVERQYNCTIIHHDGMYKEADFEHDKDLTFFILKHGI